MDLHRRKAYFKDFVPWHQKAPAEVKLGLVEGLVESPSELPVSEIVESLDIGKQVHSFMPNITPVSLFSVYLPIICPEIARAHVDETRFILTAWKVRDAWYTYVEEHESPDMSRWSFWEQLSGKLLE